MSRRSHCVGATIVTAVFGAAWLVLSAAAYGQAASNVTPEHQAVLDARKKVSSAQGDLSKSNASLSALITKKRQAFNASPEMVAALDAQKTAIAAYDAAKATVLGTLGAKPEYTAAVAVREEARQKLKKNRENNAPADQMTAIATACLADETIVDKMENEAFEADATTKDAKAAAAKASTEVAALKHKFEDGLKTDADYTAAKTSADIAVAGIKTAQAELQDKIKAENAAIAAAQAAQNAANQNNYNNNRGGGGGGGRRGGGGGSFG